MAPPHDTPRSLPAGGLGSGAALVALVALGAAGGCFEDPMVVTGGGGGSGAASTSSGTGGASAEASGAQTTGAGGDTGVTTGGESDLGEPAVDAGSGGQLVVDLVELACAGSWQSGMGPLACPGEPGDLAGAVVPEPGAGLEDDSDHLGPVLRTLPDYLTQQTFVQGRFPPHLVEPGEVLVTGLACEASAINCAVDWQLAAEDLGGADLGVLAEGSEAFDGVVSEVTVPLDALSGKNIRIVLTVGAGLEFSSHDSALWLSPRILRP